MPHRRHFHHAKVWRSSLLVAALALAFNGHSSAQTSSLPTGLAVVSGNAQLTQQGNKLWVQNSPGAHLQWQSFNIGTGQQVYFQQNNASSQVLNQVTGNNPSNILGQLGSNGKVWLINPHGVLFGKDAVINVAGLVASSSALGLPLSGSGFGSADTIYSLTGTGASVVNLGNISAASGGQVLLIGSQVRNEGSIQTPSGQLGLYAGQDVTLIDTGTPNLGVQVRVPAGEVLNLGHLQANGGRVDVHAASINQQGIVEANSLGLDANGTIVLSASQDVQLGSYSLTQATGLQGGQHGGQVHVLGQDIVLAGGSRVNVDGQTGGGQILVGGSYRGLDRAVVQASSTSVDSGASLSANALHQGDGGEVVAWSKNQTSMRGDIQARGGPQAGNGGRAEVSGKQLAFAGTANLSAPNGKAGSLLLDPTDIIIASGGPDPLGSTSTTATIDPNSITAITNTGTAVTLQADNDLTVNNAITTVKTGASGGDLTLRAGHALTVNANIATDGGALTLVSNDQTANLTNIDAGHGDLTVAANVSLTTNGGAANLTVGTLSIVEDSWLHMQNNASLDTRITATGTGGGNVSLTGGTRGYANNQITNRAEYGLMLEGASINVGTGAVAAVAGSVGAGQMSSATDAASLSTSLWGGSVSISATSASNGTLNLSGGGSGGMTGTQLTSAGDMTLRSTGGSVNFIGFAPSSLTSTSGKITLEALTGVSLGGVNVTAATGISASGEGVILSVGGFGNNIGSSLRTTANGPISLTGSRSIFIQGSSIDAGDGAVALRGGEVTFYNFPSLNTTTKGGSVLIDASGSVSLYDTELQARSGDINLSGGALTLSTVNGTTSLTSSGSISLHSTATSNTGTAVFLGINQGAGTAQNIEITADAGDIDIGAVSGGVVASGTKLLAHRNLSVQAPGYVNLFNSTATASTGTLNLYGTTDVGNYVGTQLSSAGDMTLRSTGGGVRLMNATSTSASGSVTSTNGQVAIEALTNINFDNTAVAAATGISASGADVVLAGTASTLRTRSNGPINLTGSNRVDMLTAGSIDAGSGAVNLRGGLIHISNAPSDPAISIKGGSVSLRSTRTSNTGTAVFLGINQGAGTAQNIEIMAGSGDIDIGAVSGSVVASGTKLLAHRNLSVQAPGYVNLFNSTATASTGTLNLYGTTDVGNYVGTQLSSAGDMTLRSTGGGVSLMNATSTSASGSVTSTNGQVAIEALTNVYFDNTAVAAATGISASGADVVLTAGTASTLRTSANGPINLTGSTRVGMLAGSIDAGNGSVIIHGGSVDIAGSSTSTIQGGSVQVESAGALTLINPQILARNGDINLTGAGSMGLTGTTLTGADKQNINITNTAGSIFSSGSTIASTGTGNLSLSGQSTSTHAGVEMLSATINMGGGGLSFNAGAGSQMEIGGNTQISNTRISSPLNQSIVLKNTISNATSTPTPNTVTLSNVTAENLVLGNSLTTLSAGTGGLTVTNLTFDAGQLTGTGGMTVSNLTAGAATSERQIHDTQLILQNSSSIDSTGGLALQNATLINQGTTILSGSGPVAMNGNAVIRNTGTLALASDADFINTAATPASLTGNLIDNQGLLRKTAGLSADSTHISNVTLTSTGVMDLQAGNLVVGAASSGAVHDVSTSALAMTAGATYSGPLPNPPPVIPTERKDTEREIHINVRDYLQPGMAGTTAADGRVLDVMPSVGIAETIDGKQMFTAVPLSSMSKPQIEALIASRAAMKEAAVAGSISTLESNPKAANTKECASAADAESGDCLLNTDLVRTLGRSANKINRSGALIRATLPQIERKVAILFGINNYQNPHIPTLENALPDAQAVGALFAKQLGYEVTLVPNAKKSDILRELNRLVLELDETDSVAIYYAGHGETIRSTGLGYWIPSDGDTTDPKNWVSNEDVDKLLALTRAKQVLLMTDSCYAAPFAKETSLGGLRIRTQVSDANAFLQKRNVTVMTSGGDEPVADDGKDGHSVFAWNLMESLKQLDKWRPGTDLFDTIREAVQRDLPQSPRYAASNAAGHEKGADYVFEFREVADLPGSKASGGVKN